jgi:hypothetical protein
VSTGGPGTASLGEMADSDSRAARLARNEVSYRDANERRRGAHVGDVEREEEVRFVCECPDLTCDRGVRVSLPEYEAIRSHPRRFLVAPGHEVTEIEVVLERHGDRLTVVEKRDEAGEVAERADPRET